MSFATRLKEQRIRMGLTQVQLANALGVSKGAVGNYEIGTSSPKADNLYQLFDILKCDANYLFQDEMRELHEAHATPDEMENLVKKYRTLDGHGKQKHQMRPSSCRLTLPPQLKGMGSVLGWTTTVTPSQSN